MKLPENFLQRMKNDLQNEYTDFIKCYEENPYSALRVNTLKILPSEFKESFSFCGEGVDWCGDGFYYEGKKGTHPSSIAGLFYSQEPSAMATAELADIKRGEIVLDLCAAPGGKSTQIAAKLGGEGLLVSNEINSGRAKILCENIQRLGIRNAVVTNMHPEKMEKCFEGFFDKVIVDAPCSGEGMFRKDIASVTEWSIEHTVSCSQRQLSILDSAYKMLKSGGSLVYSTCTFARIENEEVCSAFEQTHPDMEIVKMHRLMPHKVKGEGHFCALFIKNGTKINNAFSSPTCAKAETVKIYRQFEKENLNVLLDGNFISFGDYLYLAPKEMINPDKIKCVCMGLLLGEIRKGRFIPSHHLCMALKKDDFKRTIALSDDEITLYVKGEAIVRESEKGYGAMLYNEKYPIGWYKYSDGYAKNHYPKNLRN